MKLKRIIMADGENYSILLDSTGLPLPYPNLFVTKVYRNNSEASSSCHAVFERIRYFYEICDFLNIDIVRRCITGNFLTKLEIESIAKWAKRKVTTFRKHVKKNKSKNVISFVPKVNKLEAARATIITDHEGDISPSTAYNRLTTYAKYIGWLEEELFPSKTSTSENELKSFRPKKISDEGETGNMDEDYKSLTSIEMIKVLDIVRPDSSSNPWKNESLKYRNQLMTNMLEAIGCRRGELLKIKIEDIKRHPKNGRRYVTIRSTVDLDDRRLDRPEAKTLGRHVPLDKRLSNMIDDYLIEHRSKVNGAESIPYLFITHNHKTSKNNALSKSAINKVCRQISKVVAFRVHPHAFRHTWNDRFSDNADKRIVAGKTTDAKSESDRQKLMGWREDSKMAKHYSKRHENKRAFDVGMELQEKGSSNIEKIVGGYDEDIEY